MSPSNTVQIQPAYILHSRPFRETSLLLEVFSRDYGRISLLAKGARGKRGKKVGIGGLLQPFVPLLLSWRGRGSLLTLVEAEPFQMPAHLPYKLLPSGWYLNELIIRTLKPWDNYETLFNSYHKTLKNLSINLLVALRSFEKDLLKVLGILPQLDQDYVTGQAVDLECCYIFINNYGITRAPINDSKNNRRFEGRVLLAIENNGWETPRCLATARWIFNTVLEEVLSGHPIRSRELL